LAFVNKDHYTLYKPICYTKTSPLINKKM